MLHTLKRWFYLIPLSGNRKNKREREREIYNIYMYACMHIKEIWWRQKVSDMMVPSYLSHCRLNYAPMTNLGPLADAAIKWRRKPTGGFKSPRRTAPIHPLLSLIPSPRKGSQVSVSPRSDPTAATANI